MSEGLNPQVWRKELLVRFKCYECKKLFKVEDVEYYLVKEHHLFGRNLPLRTTEGEKLEYIRKDRFKCPNCGALMMPVGYFSVCTYEG